MRTEISNKYKCNWLDILLKELLHNKDLKMYNRVKCITYYYPELLGDMSMNDFKTAIKYADETYVCLGNEDKRYPMFDKIYRDKHEGTDFETHMYGEVRYITIDDICKFFNL